MPSCLYTGNVVTLCAEDLFRSLRQNGSGTADKTLEKADEFCSECSHGPRGHDKTETSGGDSRRHVVWRGGTRPQPKIVQHGDVTWEPHPQLANARVAYLLSNRDENMDLTCMLVHLPRGSHVERHTHECDDIVYVIKGKAKMWIEDIGDVPLNEGTFVRIPKGVAHQPHSIERDFVAYDVFYPFIA